MSIWNKVLLGLIIFTSFFFIFFAARALKTHQVWREKVVKNQKDLDRLTKDNITLKGDGDTPGLRQAILRLHNLSTNRGRVWTKVAPGGFNAEDGSLTVTTEQASPQGMVGTVLFAFSETPVKDGGRYLGQFTVTNQAEKQLQLKPSEMMTHAEIERLKNAAAGGTWVMYDVMPPDDPESFAGIEEATKREMLPKSTVEEYLNEGQTQPDGSKAYHKFRDYGVLMTGYHRDRALLFEHLAAAKHDKHYLQDALAGSHKQEQQLNKDINQLKTDLTAEERRRDAVTGHLKAVESKLQETKTQITQLSDANRKLVGEIARIQIEATRQIDQRTQGMAQSSH